MIDHAVNYTHNYFMANIGRPKEFDREKALDRAIELFWTQGYEATGMKDLLHHMQIGRQSLYDTFGDKHNLFVVAIKRYNQRVTQQIVDHLASDGSPLENIRDTLFACACQVSDGKCRGCLITNTLVELASHDEEIASTAVSALHRIESAFAKALKQAVNQGELPAGTNVRSRARYLTTVMQGLSVMGKASTRRAALKDVINVTLGVL